MNTQRLLTATLIGGIVYFFSGWLLYGMLLKDTMAGMWSAEAMSLNKTEPDYILIAVGCLVGSFLLALIFERWAGIKTWQTGAIAGAVISFLATFNFDLGLLAMTNILTGMGAVVTDSLMSAVMGAIGGAVIGFTLGYNRN